MPSVQHWISESVLGRVWGIRRPGRAELQAALSQSGATGQEAGVWRDLTRLLGAGQASPVCAQTGGDGFPVPGAGEPNAHPPTEILEWDPREQPWPQTQKLTRVIGRTIPPAPQRGGVCGRPVSALVPLSLSST